MAIDRLLQRSGLRFGAARPGFNWESSEASSVCLLRVGVWCAVNGLSARRTLIWINDPAEKGHDNRLKCVMWYRITTIATVTPSTPPDLLKARLLMSIEAHRWLMTAPQGADGARGFQAAPQAGEVTVAIAGCGVCHTDLGYFYDGVRTNQPLPLALGHEISGRVVDAGAGAGGWLGKSRDRSGGAALRRMRPVPPRPDDHLPRAEDARQRHPGRLRFAHRGARTRTVRGRSGAPAKGGPGTGPGFDRRRCAHDALPGGAAGRRDAGQPGHRGRRRRRRRLLRAGRARLRRDRGGDRRRRRQARRDRRTRRVAHAERPRRSTPRPSSRPSTPSPSSRACARPNGSSSNARAARPASSRRTACWCTAPRCRWSASPWTRSRCACPT